ncbi:MAG: adenylate/guanylate cyclase domain-containing protein [Leptolyngbyaceae cyanobacterium CSU_1_3]|nr:adenylate/guanylate cyclase domain-containing protein [Leptolyngbyaceae cyanobacterium CSU_1_3]
MPRPSKKSSTRNLTLLYIASLSTVALLSILGQALVQSILLQQTVNAKVIGSANRQQILSWQLREAVLALRLGTTANDQTQQVKEIRRIVEEWSVADRELQTTIAQLQAMGVDRAKIQQRVDALTPAHERIHRAAEAFLNETSVPRSATKGRKRVAQVRDNAGYLREIRDAGKEFADGINQLILTYNQQTQSGLVQLRYIEYGLLGLMLLVLLLEGILVFRPAVEKIHQTLNKLAIALEETQETAQKLAAEQAQSERLLLNILPAPIAMRLKQNPQNQEAHIADGFSEVTVLFADIVGFTELSRRISPQQLVSRLNRIFSMFDQLAEHHGLEKIKTIGDAYMVVGGLPNPRADHAVAIAEMALDIQRAIVEFNQETGETFAIRMGINTGAVVAGVIGLKKFIYDLWGDTVNIASRMESHGIPGGIQLTEATYELLKDFYHFEPRGIIEIKGRGEMMTYWLKGKRQ